MLSRTALILCSHSAVFILGLLVVMLSEHLGCSNYFFLIDFVLPGWVSVPGAFLSTVFVKLSELKWCRATRGSFPHINIETKMNCLTLSKVSMW